MSKPQKNTVKLAGISTRPMTPSEESRFEAAIDAWLSVIVQRHFARPQGEGHHESTIHSQSQLRRTAAQ
jgi:hypothetical protein